MTPPDDGWVLEVSVPAPSLENNTADAQRLALALKSVTGKDTHIDLAVQRDLPRILRASRHRVRCVLFESTAGWVVAGVLPADDRRRALGLAVDLGTSRVVIRLLDLYTGETLGEASFDNPQVRIGPDILTRIHHADEPGNARELQNLILEAITTEADSLCRQADADIDQVFLSAVAGNTAMTHLFLGLNPRWMIREPYIPATNRPGILTAAEIGLPIAPGGRVLVFPNIGSYFGGDLIAGILYTGLYRRREPAVLVDVGTNAEVVLGNSDWLIACAGAAGPALEGGVTRMGMMAGEGVIDRIRIQPENGDVDVRTIGNAPPRGICGSGLIDLAAQMFLAGMLDIRGRLIPERCGARLTVTDELAHFVVVPASASATGEALTISQADLDSLIRSKAAMYTILETIHQTVGMDMADLSAFLVAGTFGAYIDPDAAIAIGMLPDLPRALYRSIGNSSLEGAARALQRRDSLGEIEVIRDRITYMELNVNQDFMNRFSAAKFLPHTDAGRFPSVSWPGSGGF